MSTLNTSLFEITKRSPRPYKSLVAPTGASGRGIAYIEDPALPGTAKLADGTITNGGFVTRPILAGGPGLADAIFPNRIELPFSDSDPYGTGANMISLEHAEEVEAEGYDPLHVNGFLYSGAGKTITAATPIGTEVSFRNGQFCIAVAGDVVEWEVTEFVSPMIAGNVRVRFTAVHGYVK